MADRKAATMQLSGNDYAKVAERLRLFRNDFPKSKTETSYEFEVDKTVIFTVWIWKEKADLLDLMKNGVTDKDILRSSADANGTAKSKGEIGNKDKDFEKLETIALGRALGMLGYLASGEIASFEEQKEFEEFRKQQKAEATREAVESLENTKTIDELKKAFAATNMMENPIVVAAKDKRKSELATVAESKPAAVTPAQTPAVPTETPTAVPVDEVQA
jgi:hypothetical protein